MTDELPIMVRTVEQFIEDKTGKKVRIIFNDPMRIRMHITMLNECYNIALAYYDNLKK